MEEHYYVVIQNGMIHASVYGNSGHDGEIFSEAMRYAEQYEDDGPIMVAKVVYETPQE
jgi:hypothetical protein